MEHAPPELRDRPTLGAELIRIIEARHHDPAAVLGRHPEGPKEECIRLFIPQARSVRLTSEDGPELERLPGPDFFEWRGPKGRVPNPYEVVWTDGEDRVHRGHDPYAFAPLIPEFDLHLFGEGRHWHVYRQLGAHPRVVDGVPGILFATWAPNAERVSVVGDFNRWDGRVHAMRVRGGSGVWELFIPDLEPGTLYKFEIRNRHSGAVVLKTDPYGHRFEYRPNTAAVVCAESSYAWNDESWLTARPRQDWQHAPMSVYEVHLGSWQREGDGGFLNYRELAHRLVDYLLANGFTHLELMPVGEHPLDASWGYQATGYFAPTSRFGAPDDFRYFVDHCHRHGIGVIVDWVPAHFPKDAFALARFDGSPLYEHEDPRRGEHRDWGTYIYNYGRNEVRNFLLSSAMYWIEEFHIDGLRVDAVASLLYLDYSRQADDWVPNIHGGNENLEAIDFLREFNSAVQGHHPGALVIAEESTSWPQVTRPTWLGGLGFTMKWNMGWMHDTLKYLQEDPIHRRYHHDKLTFGLIYAFTENFVLPFSHDEVVHGKGSMLNKMPGDTWQRFANLRLLYTYMFTYPGKKLLFMGNEFGQEREWDFDGSLDWGALDQPLHRGLQSLVGDLNRLYREDPALHRYEFDGQGFEWIDCHDTLQSALSYRRRADGKETVAVFNFTPVPRHGYRLGVPLAGHYRERINSDSGFYGGSDVGNGGGVHTEPVAWMGHPQSLCLNLPPLAGIVLQHEA